MNPQKQHADVISVTELSGRINSALEGRIGRVDVEGQINSPKLGRHWYFTLTDGEAKIDCAMWASRVSAIKPVGWKPVQGDQVIIRGTVGHYAKYGKTQIYVEQINSVGDEKGKLQQAYDALIKELQVAGWFDDVHKKPLPKYPKRIAVITSKSSAAVRDVIETARQRWPAVNVLIVNVPVQGEAAVPLIIEAIQRVDNAASSLGIDAIIVTRGGGSLEELWSFNDRGVVEAAYNCNTPIVAAIGHESDTTIIELVVDHRASTPTQAAMVLVPDADELLQMIQHHESRLESAARREVERSTSRIHHASVSIAANATQGLHNRVSRIATIVEAMLARRPHSLVRTRQKRLLTLHSNLKASMERKMTQRVSWIDEKAASLEAIGPMAVLQRGYSLTQDEMGSIVRSIADVKAGQQIQTVVSDGTIDSTVQCSS
jgi:exodeoxyribonuclease VII large subunit